MTLSGFQALCVLAVFCALFLRFGTALGLHGPEDARLSADAFATFCDAEPWPALAPAIAAARALAES